VIACDPALIASNSIQKIRVMRADDSRCRGVGCRSKSVEQLNWRLIVEMSEGGLIYP
jgi:hypothetical protein